MWHSTYLAYGRPLSLFLETTRNQNKARKWEGGLGNNLGDLKPHA